MASASDVLRSQDQASGSSRVQRIRRGVRRHGFAYLLLAPLVIVLIAFLAIPFFSLFYFGLQKTELSGGTSFVGLDNFRLLFNEPRFLQNIAASLVYLVGVLVISVPIAYFAAALITSSIRGVGFLRTIFLIPWVLAPVVTALLFKTLFDPSSGPVSIVLSWLAGQPVYPALSPQGARILIIIHSAWRSFPLEMILIAAGMASIPRELYEAARVDGASLWQQFTRYYPSLNAAWLSSRPSSSSAFSRFRTPRVSMR